ncbi:pleckstriny domain-containing family S member 1 [Grus japonensis]|uniref:Pleckstriny domain-containing family S member 1 n=1 Tax=Grus japonensis TaxID=30415 RepID=A0ABC9X378_GRUJA
MVSWKKMIVWRKGAQQFYLLTYNKRKKLRLNLKQPLVRAQDTFCPEGGVCKHGFLIKSPPPQLFSSQENGPSEDKNRPNSDPGPHQAQCDSPRGVFASLDKNLEKSEENLLSSDTDEDIKKDEDDYYQTPSSILAKCTTEVAKPDPTAESDVAVQEKPVQKNPVKENIYMSMKSLQVTDKTQLQNLDIFVPLADIKSYLKLTEAAGQICVSQWTGPCRLGCLFNHGDHIVAVNDLQPQDVEEAYFFISRSTRKEVAHVPEKKTSMINGVQRSVCAEFCIKTEGNPSSGTTEGEHGRKDIPWELFSKAAARLLCFALPL